MAQEKIQVTSDHISSIQNAIDLVGSPKLLADFLGVTRANIYLWVNGYQPIPLKHAEKLSQRFPEEIDVITLRPDILQYEKYFLTNP